MVHADPRILSAQAVHAVTLDDTATKWGNVDLKVLSTPAILGHTERLCAEVMTPHLGPGEMSVGVNVTMHHRAPTPVGAKVIYQVATGTVERKTEFRFTVQDEHGTVLCEGTHLRAVIDAAGFLARLADSRLSG